MPLNGRINHWDWDTWLPHQLFTCVMFHGLKMRAAFITALTKKYSQLSAVRENYSFTVFYIVCSLSLYYVACSLSSSYFITQLHYSQKPQLERCWAAVLCLLMLSWPQTYSCIRLVLNRKSDEVLLRDSISIMPRKCHGLPVYISEKRNTPSGKQDVWRMSSDYF